MTKPTIRSRIESAFEAWGHWVVRRRIPVIVAVLALSAGFISNLPRVEINTDMESFLLDDDPTLLTYNEFRDDFGRDDRAMIGIRPPAVFEFEFLEKLRALHDALEAEVPNLHEVDSLINARSTRGATGELIVEDLFEDWPEDAEALAVIRDRALENPIYQNLILSEDAKYTTLAVRLNTYSAGEFSELDGFEEATGDSEFEFEGEGESQPLLSGAEILESMRVLREVVARYEGPDFEVYIAGPPALSESLTTSMSRDMQRFLGISILASALILSLLFRRISGTILPIVVVLLSLLTAISVMPLLDIPIQVPTQVLPAFLLAVGMGDSVHILAIFYQRLASGASKEDAIAGALGHSGFPVLMTSLTTAGALLSFTSATLAPIRNLGIVAPIGVMLALLYTFTLLPALLALVPIAPKPQSKTQHPLLERFLTRCGDVSTQRPWAIVSIAAVLLAVAFVGASQLRFSHNPVGWFPEGDPLRTSMELFSDELKGIVTIEVLFETGTENALHDPEFLSTMDELQASNETLRHGRIYIGKTLSIVDILKEIHQALNENREEFRRIPDDRMLIAQELLLFENSGSEDLADFSDSLFSTGRMTLRAPWVDAIQYAPVVRTIEKTYQERVGDDVTVTVTGLMPLLSRTFEAVILTMSRSYVIAILVITPLMMLLLASVRLGLLSMIPNLTPIILTLAVMGIFGFPLDGFTLLIGSIALGLAVDDTIHFMHGFNRYYAKSGDAVEAVHSTLATSGQAMLVTTLVLCSGFLTFTMGYMESTFNFGFLTALTLGMAFLADVLLAPALMVLVTRSRRVKPAE